MLYSIFLSAIALSGVVLTLGLVHSSGPVELSAIPAVAAMLGITLCLGLARRRGVEAQLGDGGERGDHARRALVKASARMIGEAVGEACRLVRLRDPRLAGAIAYWAFDAAVVWAMLRAFGSPPVLPVIALAYLIGQVANTLPIPGSVSGGMTGVLVAFGVPVELALPPVLAYRGVAIWLPSPVAIGAVPALRATVARCGREDAVAASAA